MDYKIEVYGGGCHKTWGVYSPDDRLVCVCVYKKGATNVASILNGRGWVAEVPTVNENVVGAYLDALSLRGGAEYDVAMRMVEMCGYDISPVPCGSGKIHIVKGKTK